LKIGKKVSFLIITVLSIFYCTSIVSANMIWPSLYIEEGMLSLYVITGGFVIEFLCVKFCAKQEWLMAFKISALMNGVSAVVGIILIPLSGYFAGLVLVILPFDSNIINILFWLVSYILVVLCNVIIEGAVLDVIFFMEFKDFIWWLIPANLFSVIMCLFHLDFYGFK